MTLRKVIEQIGTSDALLDAVMGHDPETLYFDVNDAGTQGNEVMAWATEANSINDDGRNAVIRVIIPTTSQS
jgi:hypothetical protein